jgi:hypothetical protein
MSLGYVDLHLIFVLLRDQLIHSGRVKVFKMCIEDTCHDG